MLYISLEGNRNRKENFDLRHFWKVCDYHGVP